MNMLTSFWRWLTQFDVIKGIILGIAVIVSSWYDLRAEVRESRADAQQIKIDLEKAIKAQEIIDAKQDARTTERYQDLKDAIRDLHADVRTDRRNQSQTKR